MLLNIAMSIRANSNSERTGNTPVVFIAITLLHEIPEYHSEFCVILVASP
jgi:hypothetical protein